MRDPRTGFYEGPEPIELRSEGMKTGVELIADPKVTGLLVDTATLREVVD